MGHSWVSVAGWITLAGSLAIAWLKGSWAERWGALLLLFSNVSSDIAIAISFPSVPQLFLFGVDFALAAGLLILALRFSSFWLGVAMLLQATALCAHAFRLTGDGLHAFWWMVLNNVVSQLMLICIVIAAAMSWRARRRPPPPPAFIVVTDAPAH